MTVNHRCYGIVLLGLLLGVAGPVFWAHGAHQQTALFSYTAYFGGMALVVALFVWFCTALGVLILKRIVWSLHLAVVAILITSFVTLTLAGYALHDISPPAVGLVFMFSSVIGIFMHGITVLFPTRPQARGV